MLRLSPRRGLPLPLTALLLLTCMSARGPRAPLRTARMWAPMPKSLPLTVLASRTARVSRCLPARLLRSS